jgi:hypothetical protein
VIPEYQKEIAIFRNGYVPNLDLLKKAKSRQVDYGANFLEKWVSNLTLDNKKTTLKKVAN